MNLECADINLKFCRSPSEHSECIIRTFLFHYCTVEITTPLRCCNEMEVKEVSVVLMK